MDFPLPAAASLSSLTLGGIEYEKREYSEFHISPKNQRLGGDLVVVQ